MLLLALIGCPYVGETTYETVRDADSDGVAAIRFGGQDCDDERADIGPCDADGDGVHGVLVGGADCDDSRLDVFPGAVERCDGIDNDCDGRVDDEDPDVDAGLWYRDDDGDGYGDGEPLRRCVAPAGFVALDGDCNDDVTGVRPGVVEQCDAVDWNCDGEPELGAVRVWFEDADGDGYGDPALAVGDGCDPPVHDTAVASNGADCDDNEALAHPIGTVAADPTERCDGIDSDCDGLFDADDPSLADSERVLLFRDDDGDGFGGGPAVGRCPNDVGFVTLGDDCDDREPLVNPGASETCAPGDEDCDGLLDSADPDNDGRLLYPDADGDGLGSVVGGARFCETGVISGFVEQAGDCNDTLASIQGEVAWTLDLDQDGYGAIDDPAPVLSCSAQPGRSAESGDCDDLSADVHPGADERCDEVDNDCNGIVDDGAADVVSGYLDNDGDGFGQQGTFGNYCFAAAGNDLDCDDTNGLVHPFAAERCDDADLDEDCNGLADDADPGVVRDRFYRDADLDGFGDPDEVVVSCEPVPGHVDNQTDCDDTNPSKYFSSFTVTATPALRTDGLDVGSIQEVLDSPARCPDVTAVIDIELDVVAFPPLSVGPAGDLAGLTLRDLDGSRARLCMPDTSTVVSGPLRIEGVSVGFGDVDACDGTPPDRPVFALEDAGGVLEVVDSELIGHHFAHPLVGHTGVGPNDAIVVTLDDVRLADVEWDAPLVDLPTAGAEVRFDGIALDGAVGRAPLVEATLDEGFPTTPRWTVALVDSRLHDVDLGSHPLFEVRGGYSVQVLRSRLEDVATTAPLFCLEAEACSTSPTPVSVPDGVHVDLTSSAFVGLPAGPLVWMAGATEVRSVGNVYQQGQHPLVNEADHPDASWLSLRDRFVDLSTSGLPLSTGTVAVNESHVIRSELELGGLAHLQNTALADSDVTADALTATGNVHAGVTSVAYPTTGAGTSAWFLPGAPRVPGCGGPSLSCETLDADLSTYHPDLPADRWVLFPADDQVERVFLFGAVGQSAGELHPLDGAVPWGEDPNQDGLPAAWLVFHASSPTCHGLTGLFDPQGDPDGDLSPNVQEVLDGTWPCVPDTDGDGTLDLADAFPLDPLAQ